MGAFGRLTQQEARGGCWAAVVARHARDDWPPPEWLAVTAEGGSDPHEAPVLLMPAEEHAA